MLEWLTPQGTEAILNQISQLGFDNLSSNPRPRAAVNEATGNRKVALEHSVAETATSGQTVSPTTNLNSPGSQPPPHQCLRQYTSSAHQRRRSLESSSGTTAPLGMKHESRSSYSDGFCKDKPRRLLKGTTSIVSRRNPETAPKPVPPFFENVTCPPQRNVPVKRPPVSSNGVGDSVKNSRGIAEMDHGYWQKDQSDVVTLAPTTMPTGHPHSWADSQLPQALKYLSIETIDFICDTLEADGTTEDSLTRNLPPYPGLHEMPHRRGKGMVDQNRPQTKTKWKLFAEQSFFSVLSDPQSLIASFTQNGQLYDSHTLWYCMLRMTRATPSLVFHSLWLVAESLFAPGLSTKAHAGPNKTRSRQGVSQHDTECIVSICLHALVAFASVVADSKGLHEMSRIRSNGLAIAGRDIAARQPPSLCLLYDDVFSYGPALRLARRIFSAIQNHRNAAAWLKRHGNLQSGGKETDILHTLFTQLDLLGPDTVRVLEFPAEGDILPETQITTLLLDWAKTVLLDAWDGRPDFMNKGAFSGALTFLKSMC
ncbi:hypothetical protein S7711_07478 [Stachybotrys chartarum IBT 7711]|uniref:Uncharacterized protein n=1 Tax=Stachybotrys chartarum (strain CBS 109288 / IBT 7711) TaxID=1280523 RepID=A0A084AFQ4_STACB|nr:hypothetical protein S7711_07478 [Stachybotrys chartarum IBT 7711]